MCGQEQSKHSSSWGRGQGHSKALRAGTLLHWGAAHCVRQPTGHPHHEPRPLHLWHAPAHLQDLVPRLPKLLIQGIQLVDARQHGLRDAVTRRGREHEGLAPGRAQVLVRPPLLVAPLASLRGGGWQAAQQRSGRQSRAGGDAKCVPAGRTGGTEHGGGGVKALAAHVCAAPVCLAQSLIRHQKVVVWQDLPRPARRSICRKWRCQQRRGLDRSLLTPISKPRPVRSLRQPALRIVSTQLHPCICELTLQSQPPQACRQATHPRQVRAAGRAAHPQTQ